MISTDGIRSILTIVASSIVATIVIVMGYSLKHQSALLADARAELADVRRQHAEQVAQKNAVIASDLQKIFASQRSALDEKDRQLQALRSSAAATDRRVAGLLDQLAKARATARADQGQPAATPERGTTVDIYELFGQSVIEYRALAEEAERARIAGLLCERSYDALTTSDKSWKAPSVSKYGTSNEQATPD